MATAQNNTTFTLPETYVPLWVSSLGEDFECTRENAQTYRRERDEAVRQTPYIQFESWLLEKTCVKYPKTDESGRRVISGEDIAKLRAWARSEDEAAILGWPEGASEQAAEAVEIWLMNNLGEQYPATKGFDLDYLLKQEEGKPFLLDL